MKNKTNKWTDEQIDRFLATPDGKKVKRDILASFYQLHIGPIVESQMIGTIRGLDFRVAELEAENAELRRRLS